VNGLTLLVVLALAVGAFVLWRMGVVHGRRQADRTAREPLRPAASAAVEPARAPPPAADFAPIAAPPPAPASASPAAEPEGVAVERARLLRSLAAENEALRRAAAAAAAERVQLAALAEDRRRLLNEFAQARAETARYRDLVVALENDALPPLLDGPNAPDDLKLIVGVGPVLERMLHQLGVTTYRQIARWSERDIDEFDAKLPEFTGRIRRDGWVTQARELHQSKFGETLPMRERG
jgi:predicted flap endonuclease-1-like 5' DNA nuclease